MNDRLRSLLARMADLPIEDLAALLDVERQETNEHRQLAQAAEAVLLRRLAEKEASEVVAGEYVVTREQPKVRIEWDIPALADACSGWLTAKERENAMWEVEQRPRWPVNTTRIKALARKRGSEFKALVEQAEVRIPTGNPTITLKKTGESMKYEPTS